MSELTDEDLEHYCTEIIETNLSTNQVEEVKRIIKQIWEDAQAAR